MSSTEPEVPPPIQTNTAMEPCALLNEFFEQVPEAIVFVDGGGRVVRANNKFVPMFGYAPEEIIGASLSTLIVPAGLCDQSDRLAGSSSTANKVAVTPYACAKGGSDSTFLCSKLVSAFLPNLSSGTSFVARSPIAK